MQYLVHPYNDNTLRILLSYPGPVDAAVLARAAQHVVMSVDVLHASYVPGKVMGQWHVHGDVQEADYFAQRTCPQGAMAGAVEAALLPITADDKCRLHLTVCTDPRRSVLALRMSHLCMDGSDGKYLLGRLFACCRALQQTGSCAQVHIKNGDRSAGQVYAGLSKKELRSLLHSPMTGVKSAFPFAGGQEMVPCLLRTHIPAGVMAAARDKARTVHATVNDLLLAACYQAYHRLPGADKDGPVSIMSMMDLRRHLKTGDSQGLSNLTGSLPTLLPRVQEDFAQNLRSIAAQTRRLKDDPLAGLEGMPLLHGAAKRLPVRLLLQAAGRVYAHMSVGLTNLGSIAAADLALGGMEPDGMVFGSVMRKTPNMQVCALSMDGTCCLSVTGCYGAEDRALLQRMLDDMAQVITRYAGMDD